MVGAMDMYVGNAGPFMFIHGTIKLFLMLLEFAARPSIQGYQGQ